jgi:hypothetical protein
MASEEKTVSRVGSDLTPGQAQAVGGGECDAELLLQLTGQLKEAYDNLVDFTSYVIGRVAGEPGP